MSTKTNKSLTALKTILWIYIILCFVIAGLNFGYAKTAAASIAKGITWFWHFYENWIKTIFIIAASLLTMQVIKSSGRTRTYAQEKSDWFYSGSSCCPYLFSLAF